MSEINKVRDLADEVNEALGALRNLSSVHDSVAYNGLLDVLLWTNLPLLLVEVGKLRDQAEVAAPEFLIWSHHHKAWFGPTGAGYYRDITDAGRYALEDTKPWLGRGCGCCAVPEVVIPAPPASVLAAPGQTREWTAKQIKEATDARVAAGQVNKFAAVPAEAAGQS